MATEKTQKNERNYYCEICYFNTCKKTDYLRHLQTEKHNRNSLATFGNSLAQSENNLVTDNTFTCNICNKIYKDRTGLWRHKRKCKSEEEEINKNEDPSDKEIIMMLINDNKEFKQILLDVCKEKNEYKNMIMKVIENGTHNTNCNNINSNNNSFNLQFFLNETCKDAMNIMDFVDSIKLQLCDLEGVGKLGYVEGISNIIVKNLKELDVTQRPVHCTDKKRETLYIKDSDKWEKDENKETMHKVIRKVASKNQRLIPKFKEAHPDCNRSVSKFSDQYNKIIVESMGGSGDNDFEKEEKIIKNISKEVNLQKEKE